MKFHAASDKPFLKKFLEKIPGEEYGSRNAYGTQAYTGV
jgi:hypothetical protein